MHEAGLQFIGVSPEQRQKILRFVLNEMIERKKNIEVEELINYFELVNR